MITGPQYPVAVAIFAQAMLQELDNNRHKGDRKHWKVLDPQMLALRVMEEALELAEAIRTGQPARDVLSEAADVANMAMMVADTYGALK